MRQVVIGPRGGESIEDVTCDTCACATRCGFTGTNTRPWGCSMWVSVDGQRLKDMPSIQRVPEPAPDVAVAEIVDDGGLEPPMDPEAPEVITGVPDAIRTPRPECWLTKLMREESKQGGPDGNNKE